MHSIVIWGDNNNFTVEVEYELEPSEDWYPGRVKYNINLTSAMLVHGNRRREVIELLTEKQIQHVIEEIKRIGDELRADDAYDRHEAECEEYEYMMNNWNRKIMSRF